MTIGKEECSKSLLANLGEPHAPARFQTTRRDGWPHTVVFPKSFADSTAGYSLSNLPVGERLLAGR